MDNIFDNINYLKDFKYKPLFKLMEKNAVHRDLIDEYPYIDENLNLDYIDKSLKYALEIFDSLNFKDIILIYDDIYGLKDEYTLNFLKDIVEIKDIDRYRVKWTDEDCDYNLIRYIFKGRILNVESLFKEIIKTDIGGKFKLASSVYLIDLDKKILFNLYDDRGVYIIDEKSL